MKRQFSFTIMLVCCLQLLLSSATNAQAPCFTVQNFSSVCVQSTAPRKFTLNFKITASQTGTSAFLAPITGNFNNLAGGITVPLVNNQAIVSLTYNEVTPATTVKITLALMLNGNNVCRMFSEQTLVACGNLCTGLTLTINPFNLIFSPGGSLANYAGPVFSLITGIAAGPEMVSKITTTITSAKRRAKCPNTPQTAPWTAVNLPPLTAQQLGLPASQLTTTPNSAATNLTPAISYQPVKDYVLVLAAPATKLNPNCPEEYQISITVTVLFANGCTLTQTFSLYGIRP